MANISNEVMIRVWADNYKHLPPQIVKGIIDDNLAERQAILNMRAKTPEPTKIKWYKRFLKTI